MEQTYINDFAEYCMNEYDLQRFSKPVEYNSLVFCIMDCIFSSQAIYESHVKPVLERYAKHRLEVEGVRALYVNQTLDSFIEDVDNMGGCAAFVENIIINKQKLSGRLKMEVCYDLASVLYSELGIKDLNDFRKYMNNDIQQLESTIKSVRGMGVALTPYLFMLAGDEDYCKPDIHIRKCVKNVCGRDFSADEIQTLFKGAVDIIKVRFADIKVKYLDHIIWLNK